MCQQNTTKIRPERGVQLFGQSYQKITMDLVGEIKSEWPLVYPAKNSAQLYKGLQYLSNHTLSKCKIHPILKHRCYSSLDSRIPVKLRLVTGTYVLQTKRIKYYRNETDPTCLLCGAAEENVLHFILQCEKLQSERVALLSEINAIWQNEFQNNENLSEVDQLQLLIDNTIKVKPTKKNSASVARLDGLSRRLMFKLHIKRTKLLESDRDKIQTTMKKRNYHCEKGEGRAVRGLPKNPLQ